MHHLPLNTAAPVVTLLAALLLPGCEAPETPIETEPAPVTREPVTPEAAPAQAPESKEDDAQPAVEQHVTKPLKLTIDDAPHTGQPAGTFGDAPESDWLDKGPAAGNMDEAPAPDNLLPDLFDTHKDSKAVSVEGKILTDDGSEGTSTTIDGAGVNIQIQTD